MKGKEAATRRCDHAYLINAYLLCRLARIAMPRYEEKMEETQLFSGEDTEIV
jgi:hypothetical protein